MTDIDAEHVAAVRSMLLTCVRMLRFAAENSDSEVSIPVKPRQARTIASAVEDGAIELGRILKSDGGNNVSE